MILQRYKSVAESVEDEIAKGAVEPVDAKDEKAYEDPTTAEEKAKEADEVIAKRMEPSEKTAEEVKGEDHAEEPEPVKESLNEATDWNAILKDGYKALDDAGLHFNVEGGDFEFDSTVDASKAWTVLCKVFGVDRCRRIGMHVTVDAEEPVEEGDDWHKKECIKEAEEAKKTFRIKFDAWADVEADSIDDAIEKLDKEMPDYYQNGEQFVNFVHNYKEVKAPKDKKGHKAVDEAYQEKTENTPALDAEIAKLNAPDEDGEESLYRFKAMQDGGSIVIYDENEHYHIGYLDEVNAMFANLSAEFGFPFREVTVDKVHERIEDALRKDGILTDDNPLEWRDNVVMEIEIPDKVVAVQEGMKDELKVLADDEEEAIAGYDAAELAIDDRHVNRQLDKIRGEEEDHLDYLKRAQKDPKAVYVDKGEEGEGEEKEPVKEARWNKTVDNHGLHQAISDEDYDGIKDAALGILRDVEEFLGDDFETADLKDEFEVLEPGDEENCDYLLDDLYDLCDNVGVFIRLDAEGHADDVELECKESVKEGKDSDKVFIRISDNSPLDMEDLRMQLDANDVWFEEADGGIHVKAEDEKYVRGTIADMEINWYDESKEKPDSFDYEGCRIERTSDGKWINRDWYQYFDSKEEAQKAVDDYLAGRNPMPKKKGIEEAPKEAVKESIDTGREVWEGWTVQDFIDELMPSFEAIVKRNSWRKPFKNKEELGKWCDSEQPYYKKRIPEVVEYFDGIIRNELGGYERLGADNGWFESKGKKEGIISASDREWGRDELNELERKAQEALNKEGVYPEWVDAERATDGFTDVKLSIHVDGDWKHDHLLCDHVIEELIPSMGLMLVKQRVYEEGDSESDWYEATREYLLAEEDAEGNTKKRLDAFRKAFGD